MESKVIANQKLVRKKSRNWIFFGLLGGWNTFVQKNKQGKLLFFTKSKKKENDQNNLVLF
ncbi:MAG: hypothetical protein CM1200mP1_08370 [Candidatus Neomarinimicrobiota bacterium]|nr:MAG: hypothetical protein CM1200mP1_08370 [Candidatus Neomarinimicrobiota bacterium]